MSTTLRLFDVRPETPERMGVAKVVERQAKSILSKATGSLASFDFTMNPYVGCSLACSYCYAAFFVPDEAKARDWGNWVEVKSNALHLLARHRRLEGTRIFVGSVTDPYQPIEAKLELTRSLLDHLSRRKPQPRLLIHTRSPLAARDIDIFRRFDDLRVSMSITTDDEEMRKLFEPSCASIDRRIEALREIRRAGVSVGVSICPMLPIRDPESFALKLAGLRADSIWSGYFHDSTRQFAAGTRPEALRLARELGWTHEKFLATADAMRPNLPGLRAH